MDADIDCDRNSNDLLVLSYCGLRETILLDTSHTHLFRLCWLFPLCFLVEINQNHIELLLLSPGFRLFPSL
jgi:hypothetical protein